MQRERGVTMDRLLDVKRMSKPRHQKGAVPCPVLRRGAQTKAGRWEGGLLSTGRCGSLSPSLAPSVSLSSVFIGSHYASTGYPKRYHPTALPIQLS